MRIYSHSQLDTFKTCPLRYKFRYIDKLERLEENVEAFVGSQVHKVLEKLYRDMTLEKRDTLEELLEFYRRQWQAAWGPQIRIREPGLTQENYFDYGAQCIRNYYLRYHPFAQSRTLQTELRLDFALDPARRYRMQGYIDRVALRANGAYEIHDYKTGRELPSQEQMEHDCQLGLYEFGLRRYWPQVEKVELIWHYVGFDSTFRSARTPDRLEDLRLATIDAIDRIEREKKFEPVKGSWCDWCEYRASCPLWKHVDAMASLAPAKFAADTGVQLANEYAQTKFEIDRLEERLTALRERLVEFARQHALRVLAGNGVRVQVTIREMASFPKKDDPLRDPLEKLVKQSGRWAEVSDLSLTRLTRVLEQEEWPPDLLRQLRQFVATEASVTLRVTRTGLSPEDGDLEDRKGR